MSRLTPAQRLQIIQLYHDNNRSTRSVFRALRATYGPHNRPTERTIRYTIEKFATQSSITDNTRPNRPHPACNEENIAAVAESLRNDRDVSIRRRSQQLGLSYATTWRILRILKGADLSTTSAKKVRQELEEKLGVNLASGKKEVDEIVMQVLKESGKKGGSKTGVKKNGKKGSSKKGVKKNGNKEEEDEDKEEEDEEEKDKEEEKEEEEKVEEEKEEEEKDEEKEEEEKDEEEEEEEKDEEEDEEEKDKNLKRAGSKKLPPAKKKKTSSDESEDEQEDKDSDEEYSPSENNKGKGRKKKGSDFDEDWDKDKKDAVKEPAGSEGDGCTLTPELAAVVGTDSIERHKVVK